MNVRCLLLAIGLLSGITSAPAALIVSDTFTGTTNGASVAGRTPQTDAPARNFATSGIQFMSFDTSAGNAAPSVSTSFNSTMYIDISSNGGAGYTKLPILTISADIQIGGISPGTFTERGIGLGFFSVPNAGIEATSPA